MTSNLYSVDRECIKSHDATNKLARFVHDLQMENLSGEFSEHAVHVVRDTQRTMLAVATSIVHGDTGISSFSEQAVNDPNIRALAQRVEVVEAPELTAMMPAQRPSRVRITLKDGRELDAESFVNKGDLEDPYTAEELQEKYYGLTDPIWGHETAEKIHAKVMAPT